MCLVLHRLKNKESLACVYSEKTQPGHTFQPASAPAHKLNPRDFPLSAGEKRGYNITSFRVREDLGGWRDSCLYVLETFPD